MYIAGYDDVPGVTAPQLILGCVIVLFVVMWLWIGKGDD